MNLTKKQAEKLVKGCVKNERAAQESLYRLFHADMLRICLSYLPDKELAKEAFNTGFLKVFQSVKSFDMDKGELGGWIRKIMIYTAIDLCRKEMKFNELHTELQPNGHEYPIPASVLDKLYFEELLVYIRRLPLATQTVFNLSVLDGFTHKEIGEQLNISEGTSRWHLAEAKKQLRILLDPAAADRDNLKERSNKEV